MPDMPANVVPTLPAIAILRSSGSATIILEATLEAWKLVIMIACRLETAPLRSMQVIVPGTPSNFMCLSTPAKQNRWSHASIEHSEARIAARHAPYEQLEDPTCGSV